MKVPDRSFVVGVPAKIIGEVTPEQQRWAEQGTKYYLELIKKYKGKNF
jgi:carbonic anhydrase/acetyltransferase-like protein (isoleucine patch superfamily)